MDYRIVTLPILKGAASRGTAAEESTTSTGGAPQPPQPPAQALPGVQQEDIP